MTEIKKAELKSLDIAEEKRQHLRQLFPEVFAEKKVDFEKLRQVLGENIETGRERYGMNWAGKSECIQIIQKPTVATLKPFPEESVNFDTTENLFIEGDNLEVLKLLQKSYYGKVKMIYIDPPYNTGNDFIYPDNYSESLETYLKYTGQVDDEGKKFSTNTDTDGRYHTKWLNMMYPRLYLARNLLRDDGLIFVSIDSHEVTNLRRLCDEIFGEENFIESLIWKKRYQGAKEKYCASIHEYVLLYAKTVANINPFYIPSDDDYIRKYYKYKDDKYPTRGPFRTQPLEAGKSMDDRENLMYAIPAPDGTTALPKRQWIWAKERTMEALKKDELFFSKNREGGWSVSFKQYAVDESGEARETKPFSIIEKIFTQHGTVEINDLFNADNIFPFPKPSKLIKHLATIGSDENSIILDFFAGSATTAHSLLDLNKQDGGHRKFILVQLPEICSPDSEAFKAGYKTIADIGKERIRRVIKKLSEENVQARIDDNAEKPIDLGFRVFKLDRSNFRVWDGVVDTSSPDYEKKMPEQVLMHVDHIDKSATQADILYELLLKSGFELTCEVKTVSIAGKTVYSVQDGQLYICLERELTADLIKAIAEKEPQAVIFLDEGFAGNDQLKTNAALIMKSKSKETEFKTV